LTPSCQLAEKLADEAPGILRWVMIGALRYMQNGWVVPDVIQADTDKYREDVLGWFLRERVEVTKDGADSLYSMHCKRQRTNGATRAGVPNFGPKQIHYSRQRE
jgi:phage/plasmid-associated DNA primase